MALSSSVSRRLVRIVEMRSTSSYAMAATGIAAISSIVLR